MSNDIEIPCLKKKYREQIVLVLREEFRYASVIQTLGLTKIMVNTGVGEVARDSKTIDGAVRNLAAIAGQRPAIIRARKSIAQSKLREGMPIGCHVTLRGSRMWESADRLLTLTLPHIRDFCGLNGHQSDGKDNYTSGLNEQVMFLEIDQDKIDCIRGMDIMFVTSATSDQEGRTLLEYLGFPSKAVDDPEPVKSGRGPAFQSRKKK